MNWYPYVDLEHPDMPTWRDRAACKGTDLNRFFPVKGEDVETAKAICQTCPVRSECLNYALDHTIQFGIWGGMSENQRRRMRRNGRPLTPAQQTLLDKLVDGMTTKELAEVTDRYPSNVGNMMRTLSYMGFVTYINGTWWRT